MSNYESQTLAQCKKALKKLESSKKKKPDPDAVDKNKQNIQNQINQLKLKSAELKWNLDQVNQQVNSIRAKQDAAKADLEQSNDTLSGLKKAQQDATSRLKQTFDRRIKDPIGRKKETMDEVEQLKFSLIGDSLTNAQERKVIREIKEKTEFLKIVDAYIQAGGDQLYSEREKKKKSVDNFRKEHDSVHKTFMEIREEANALYGQLDSNREERQSIKKEIGELQAKKSGLDNKYRDDVRSFRDHTRKLNELRSVIAEKEASEQESRENRQQEANRKTKETAKAKEVQEKVEKEKTQAEQKQKDIAERRRLAEEEWARVQAEQKKLRSLQAQAQKSTPDTSETTKVDSNLPDPHREQRLMCEQLIVMCKTMKANFSPAKSKKKKSQKKLNKMRLTHKPSVFSNFSMAGVRVPTKYGDLDSTVASLEEKILSFSGKTEEEEVVGVTDGDQKDEQ